MIPFAFYIALASAQTSGPTDLLPLEQLRIQEYKKVQDVRDRILAKDPYAGQYPAELQDEPEIKAMGLNSKYGEQELRAALGYRFDSGVLTGYKPIDPNGSDPVLKATINRTDAAGAPVFQSLQQGLKEMNLGVYEVHVTELPVASPSVPANAPPVTTDVYVGVLDKEDLANGLAYGEAHPSAGQPYKVITKILDDTFIPVKLYDNEHGQILAVLQKEPPQPLIFPDLPEFGVFKETPEQVKAAYSANRIKSLKSETPEWGVQEPEGIVNMEHVRRKAYLALQSLEQKVKDAHPAETSDFPPEMLQTPEFKATGLRMDSQSDESILLQALTFKPEGGVLKGYRPVDFTKDKAASYSVVTRVGNKLTDESLKDMCDGKKIYLFKLRVQSIKPASVSEGYFGPATADQLAAVTKAMSDVKITELKEQDVPLTAYTNDAGALAFVMAFRPKDVLLVPERPPLFFVFEEPLPKLAPLIAGGQDAQNVARSLHQVLPEFAIAEGKS